MFVRFRQTPQRLRASILESHRTAGKVASEHVASLGAIALPMTVRGRQAFWAGLWDRLATLSNRIGPDEQASIRNAVHARIPMVLPEEANADAAAYWATWSAAFMEDGASEREDAAAAIKRAEANEGIAAIFAENRTAALQGERPDEMIVGKLLAMKISKPTPEGTPTITENGEAGFVHYAKRSRNDRRRRRGGMRFTPPAVEGWKP
jgi:hypothetical protein